MCLNINILNIFVPKLLIWVPGPHRVPHIFHDISHRFCSSVSSKHKHLHNICTMLDQRRKRRADDIHIIQMMCVKTGNQCWHNVGPPSTSPCQHQTNSGWAMLLPCSATPTSSRADGERLLWSHNVVERVADPMTHHFHFKKYHQIMC